MSIAYANGHSRCDCYGNCDFHTYPGGITNTYTDNHRYGYAGGITDADTYRCRHVDSYSYSYSYGYCYCYGYGGSNCDRYTYTYTYTYTYRSSDCPNKSDRSCV